MYRPLNSRQFPNRLALHSQMIPALLLALLGWALGFYQIALPMGLGIRLQIALIAGLLAAAYAGGPVVGAILGLIIGSSTFGPLWAPNALAHAAALALAAWLLPKATERQGWRLYLRLAGVALLSQMLLALALAGAYALTNLDPVLFTAAGSVLAIALLPGAILTALLFPLLVKPYGIRYVAPSLLMLAVVITFATRLTPYPAAAAAVTPVEGLHAGAAIADITPRKEEQVFLGGYGGRSGPAEGALDQLHLQVLVLQEGSTRITFIAADAVGIGNKLAARMRAAGGGGDVLVSASHSHASPDLQGIWGGADRAYEDRLVEAVRAAAEEAMHNLKPAVAFAASGPIEANFQENRRGWDQTPKQLSVLRLEGKYDTEPIATLVNFAMHPTVLPRENMLASSDFVGGLRSQVEQSLGGVTLFINGAQGDVVPRTADGAARDFMAARAVGMRIGAKAVQLITTPGRLTLPANAHLTIQSEPIEFPLANWGFQALASLNMLRYQQYLAGAMPTMQSRLSLIQLGESVAMLTAPGETTTRPGLRLEAQIPAKVPFFLGLTHDSLGYLLPRDEWLTGRNENYEESVSVGPRAGALYAEAAQRLLSRTARHP